MTRNQKLKKRNLKQSIKKNKQSQKKSNKNWINKKCWRRKFKINKTMKS